jgi:hypothetical protein
MAEELSKQRDPQREMIDVIVEVIKADNHMYRTVKPDEDVHEPKKFQANVWKAGV